jgi:hypothetical protein
VGLLGLAGMVAVRAADLRSPAGPGLGRDGRTALTVAGTGRIRTGDLVVWLKPVAVTPAVVRRDGRVQAAGHPADHARLWVMGRNFRAPRGALARFTPLYPQQSITLNYMALRTGGPGQDRHGWQFPRLPAEVSASACSVWPH